MQLASLLYLTWELVGCMHESHFVFTRRKTWNCPYTLPLTVFLEAWETRLCTSKFTDEKALHITAKHMQKATKKKIPRAHLPRHAKPHSFRHVLFVLHKHESCRSQGLNWAVPDALDSAFVRVTPWERYRTRYGRTQDRKIRHCQSWLAWGFWFCRVSFPGQY